MKVERDKFSFDLQTRLKSQIIDGVKITHLESHIEASCFLRTVQILHDKIYTSQGVVVDSAVDKEPVLSEKGSIADIVLTLVCGHRNTIEV